MTWFRRRPAPAPPQLPGAGKLGPAAQTSPRQWVWTSPVSHVDGLPFGMAAYPDSPMPPKPWAGGPTPAPTRIPYLPTPPTKAPGAEPQ